MFLENIHFKSLIKTLEDKEVKSIFISSWDSIYTLSKDGYIKLNFCFEDEHYYNCLIEDILIEYNSNKEDKELYINSFKNIDIYIYKWSKKSYWVTLIKR